ncbi:hypothetical protein C2W63_03678 [Bacillus velezensis]|nr:hypothetical protein C2W63_03678 [Bacillus velezensis]
MPFPNEKKKVKQPTWLFFTFFSIRFFNSFYQLNKDKRQIG